MDMDCYDYGCFLIAGVSFVKRINVFIGLKASMMVVDHA